MTDHRKARQLLNDRQSREAREAADESVNEWFWDWVDYHTRINPRSYWVPKDVDFAFYSNWRRQFVLHGLHRLNDALQVSDRVSTLLIEEKGAFLQAMLNEFQNLLVEQRERFETEWGTNLEAAEAAAAGCLDCGGSVGLATRYRHASIRPGVDRYVVFYCLCAYGRALKANHQQDDATEGYRNRIPDLADFPQFHRDAVEWSDQPDNRYCYAPAAWDVVAGRPIPLAGGLKGLTAPTRSAADALRTPRRSRAVYTAHQAHFLGALDITLRDWFPSAPGEVRAAALAEFADDDRPYSLDTADRVVQLLWKARAAQIAAAEAEAKSATEAATVEAATTEAGGPAA